MPAASSKIRRRFAEVSIIIDNEDGRLPVEYTEVQVTRRVYRSGESEYRINGTSCRLKDVFFVLRQLLQLYVRPFRLTAESGCFRLVQPFFGDKMEDVIFAGTESRKPLGFAEVSIIIDNSLPFRRTVRLIFMSAFFR